MCSPMSWRDEGESRMICEAMAALAICRMSRRWRTIKLRATHVEKSMAAHYVIDVKNGIVRTTYSGFLTIAEMYETRRGMLADPTFKPAFAHLVDARGVKTFEINGYTIKLFSQEHVLARDARRAIVMGSTPDLGLARMFQIYRELARGAETNQIFRDMDEAVKWLGLPSDYLYK